MKNKVYASTINSVRNALNKTNDAFTIASFARIHKLNYYSVKKVMEILTKSGKVKYNKDLDYYEKNLNYSEENNEVKSE